MTMTDLEALNARLEKATADGVCLPRDNEEHQHSHYYCERCQGTGTTETYAAIIDEVAKGYDGECPQCSGVGTTYCCAGTGRLTKPPNLRLLDAWIAERLGKAPVYKQDEPFSGWRTNSILECWQECISAYSTDPSACKILLDEMGGTMAELKIRSFCGDTWRVGLNVPHIEVIHKDFETAVAMCWSRWELEGNHE